MNTKFKAGVYLFLLILLGKLITLVKDVVLSLYYGISWEADAYFIANSVPILVYAALYTAIPHVFLPLYNKIRTNYGEDLGYGFVNSFINIFLVIAIALSSLSIYFAPYIIDYISPNLQQNARNLSVDLARIFSISFAFTTVVSVFISMQHVNKKFTGSQIVPIINNSFVIISIIFLSKKLGLKVVALFAVLSWVIQIPIQKLYIGQSYRYKLEINLKKINLKQTLILLTPAFFGALIEQANALVDIYLASSLQTGNISALNYASRLMMSISLLFPMVVTTIMYPYFSDCFIKNRIQKLNVSIEKSLKSSVLLSLPLLIIALFYNVEIIKIVFERGRFDNEAAELTASIFLAYALGIVFVALRELLNKVYYSLQKAKNLLYISSLSIILNITLSFMLVETYGAQGIAMATSISVLVHVLIQIFILKNTIGSRFVRKTLPFFVKVAVSSILMVLVLIVLNNIRLTNITLLNLVAASMLAVISYIASLYFTKQKEMVFFIDKIIMQLKKLNYEKK